MQHGVDVFGQRVTAGGVELLHHLGKVIHGAHAAHDFVGVLGVDGGDRGQLGLQLIGNDHVDVIIVVFSAQRKAVGSGSAEHGGGQFQVLGQAVHGGEEARPVAAPGIGEGNHAVFHGVVNAFHAQLVNHAAFGAGHVVQNGKGGVLHVLLDGGIDGKAALLLGHIDGLERLADALGRRQGHQLGVLAHGLHHLGVIDLNHIARGAGDHRAVALIEGLLHGIPCLGDVVGIQNAVGVELGVEGQLVLLLFGHHGIDVLAVLLLHQGAGHAESMVEDAVQTGQTAVHRGAKLDHAGIHELLEQRGIGLRGRIGQEGVLGGSLVKEVAADDGRGELGRRQPQQIGRTGHTRLGMLTHEVFYIGAAFHIRGQVLQKALGYHGGVGIALEKDDIRVDFARAER